MSAQQLESLCSRLERCVAKLEKCGGGSGAGDSADSVPASVVAYDEFVEDFLKPYYAASAVLGGLIDEQAKLFQTMSDKHRDFLMVVAKNAEPKDGSVLQKLLAPLSGAMTKVQDLRSLDHKNYCSALNEGSMAFSWMGYPKAPMKFVEGIRDSVKFYTNKVLVESKNGDKKEENRAWVKAYTGLFDGLIAYIKDNHRTGPSWNASGSPATEASLSASSASLPAGVPPPPPAGVPPPPPPPAVAPKPAKAAEPDAMSKLLQQINQGTDVTKGLRKVSKDQMTHKNPELRKHHTAVPFKPKAAEYKPVGMAKKAAPKMPPKFLLEDGKKWVVEFQEGANLTIDDTNMKQIVYIYKCNKSTIQVKGKVNSIILDSCKKTGLVFDALVSGSEVVNCQSVQVQAQGQCPTVSIDKTDGCIVYLHKDCLDCQIVTAKSSEMNVSVPRDDGDYDEHPIVEQFRSYWCSTKKVFVTECVDSLG